MENTKKDCRCTPRQENVQMKGNVFPMPFSELELCCSLSTVCFTTELAGPQAQMSFACYEKSLPFSFPYVLCVDLCLWEQFWGTNVLPPQQASYHPDVSEEVRERALRFGTECTLGYLELLEHVLLVRSHLHTGSLPERILSLISF